jgi:NADH pyrophosphatase NudC (nudix superfamily)
MNPGCIPYSLNICYIGSLLGGQEKLDGEMSELKWFDRNEIPTDIAFKNGQEMIALWKKQLK